MKLLESHLLLMVLKPHPTMQTSHNLQISHLYFHDQKFHCCNVFHVGTLPLMVSAQIFYDKVL